MASKFLKHLGIGVKKQPPQPPPKPDYNPFKSTSSESSLVPSPTSDSKSSVSVSTITSQIGECETQPSSPLRPTPKGEGARPKDSGGISPKYPTSERTPLPSTSGSQEAEGPQQAESEQGAVGGSGGGVGRQVSNMACCHPPCWMCLSTHQHRLVLELA